MLASETLSSGISTAVNPNAIQNIEGKIIKQGYIFKKGGASLLSKWKLKFAVFMHKGDDFVLRIYDKRDQLHPPKHVLYLQRSSLVVGNNGHGRGINRSGVPNYPFTLVSDSKKYRLSAQSKSEQDEWVEAINLCFNFKQNNVSHQQQVMPVMKALSIKGHKQYDDDAVSTYSRESCSTSVYSHAIHPRHQKDVHILDMHSMTSAFETLSFCSEPVLTTTELSHIGGGANTKDVVNAQSGKRKAAYSANNTNNSSFAHIQKNWNQVYQQIFMMKTDGDEALLKKDLELVDVAGMFQEVAALTVKNLVDNLHWKSSKEEDPWECVKDGIRYRFLVNYDDTTSEEMRFVHAQSNHELQGMDYFNATYSDVHSELVCLVDYKGFRVMATAENNLETLSTIYELETEKPSVDEEVSLKLSQIGHQLNLKPHAVMLKDDRRVTIPTASGIAAYYDGKKGFIYVKNLHALLPMDYDDRIEDAQDRLSSMRRLRTEFLAEYPHPLCADALTPWSASARSERQGNDNEVIQASSFLREHWIPAFVKKLDQLEIRPVDSIQLRDEFHRAGVNLRYLGYVAQLSNIAFIKELCCIDMVCRVVKYAFRTRIRGAILHFKAVGATQIEDELNNYAANIFSLVLCLGEKNYKFFNDKLQPEIYVKFGFEMDYETFASLHRPAMMQGLQLMCGLTFEDEMIHDFNQTLNKSKIIGFVPQTKFVWKKLPKRFEKLAESTSIHLPREEIVAYKLARHFKSLGPASKLAKIDTSAKALIDVAAFYNAHGRYEEAKMYAQAACNAAQQNSCVHGFALAQLIESICGLAVDTHAAPDQSVLSHYKNGLLFVEYHWGKNSPWSIGLYDRLCSIYLRSKRPQQASEFLDVSLSIASNHLGKHHAITAGYLLKAGVILRSIGRTNEAYQTLTEAIHTYQALQSDIALIAEAHYHLAEVLLDKGDHDGAVNHAQRCRKLRERCFGQQDPRTIESYRQVSRLILTPYGDYKGVVTPQIKAAYREVIQNHEKIFRFLKNLRGNGEGRMMGPGGAPRRSVSQMSVYSTAKSYRSNVTSFTTSNTLKVKIPPVAGPFFAAPYAPSDPLNRQLMHKLAKQIILLKLDLLEQPNHKECIRQLRIENEEQNMPISTEDARDVIFKMAAVSPSIYIDGLLARVDEEDEEASAELGIVLQLVENEVVGLAQAA